MPTDYHTSTGVKTELCNWHEKRIGELQTLVSGLPAIKGQLDTVINDIKEVKDILHAEYVTKEYFNDKFEPIQKIINGAIGLILLTVLGALLALVIMKRPL